MAKDFSTAIVEVATTKYHEALDSIDEAARIGRPFGLAGLDARREIETLRDVALKADDDTLALELGDLVLEILRRQNVEALAI